MSPDLAESLSAERHRKFVGRVAERDLFRSALAADEPPFNVLYVFGSGGVGKTTLLREFANICKEADVQASYVDARNLEPSPDSFMGALCSALGLAERDSPFESLASRSKLQVVMVDTYESLAPLGAWMSEVFLPQLPGSLLLVLAGRNAPEPGWRADPGWQRLIRPLHLRNLSREESQTYLLRREVPPDQHKDILDFTHGHPLALSLIADVFVQRPGVRFRPAETPDVIQTILEQFVQQVPGPAHRTALESCALVRHTTETLLSHMATMPEVHELFEWLRGLAFIESGALGLFPHDVAREALVADLRWRNPEWYAELHRRARGYYAARLKQTHGQEQQRVLFDYIFLHRENAMIRPFLEWQETGTAVPEAMREGDKPALEAMVEEHEGPESALLAAYWFERQPGGVVIYRDIEQRPAGFLVKVGLHETSAEDRETDPSAGAAWRYLERHAPLRPGEKATLFRFWMARDTYQAVSAMQSLLFANVAQHYLTTPGLAFSFFPTADPDFWAPMFAYADLKQDGDRRRKAPEPRQRGGARRDAAARPRSDGGVERPRRGTHKDLLRPGLRRRGRRPGDTAKRAAGRGPAREEIPASLPRSIFRSRGRRPGQQSRARLDGARHALGGADAHPPHRTRHRGARGLRAHAREREGYPWAVHLGHGRAPAIHRPVARTLERRKERTDDNQNGR